MILKKEKFWAQLPEKEIKNLLEQGEKYMAIVKALNLRHIGEVQAVVRKYNIQRKYKNSEDIITNSSEYKFRHQNALPDSFILNQF